ncbi:hypothetical protein SNEBB_002600 [Seison nebaliae]|nr:hypothetical protein SNEBB_002600 [Seison nebaliae]
MKWQKRLYSFIKIFGPAYFLATAYIDPGNLEADLVVATVTKYKFLWLLLISICSSFFIQHLTLKLSLISGRCLGELCRIEYEKQTSMTIWIVIELLIRLTEIQLVCGITIAIHSMSNGSLPSIWSVIIANLVVVGLFIVQKYLILGIEIICGIIICSLSIVLIYMYSSINPPQTEILKGLFIPWFEIDKAELANGLIGSIIIPHTLFIYSGISASLNDEYIIMKENITSTMTKHNIQSIIIIIIVLCWNIFIFTTFAQAVPDNTVTLFDATKAIGATYGDHIQMFWLVGLFFCGIGSIITLSNAHIHITAAFSGVSINYWKYLIPTKFITFILTILIVSQNIEKLDTVIIWINILQAFCIPFVAYPLLHFVRSRRIMGSYVVSKFVIVIGWIICISSLICNLIEYIMFMLNQNSKWILTICVLFLFPYTLFIGRLIIGNKNYYNLKRKFYYIIRHDTNSIDSFQRQKSEYFDEFYTQNLINDDFSTAADASSLDGDDSSPGELSGLSEVGTPADDSGPPDDSGPGDESGPPDDSAPGDESGPPDDSAPGDDSEPGDESGPPEDSAPGEESGPSDDSGPVELSPAAVDESGPGEESNPTLDPSAGELSRAPLVIPDDC